MSLTTKLTDKLEREIRDFCKMNGLQLGEYIAKCIEKQFNLDRYGDLNDRFLPIEITKKETPVIKPITEDITVSKSEPDNGTIFVEKKRDDLLQDENIQTPPVLNDRNENVPQEPVKKKRVRIVESK